MNKFLAFVFGCCLFGCCLCSMVGCDKLFPTATPKENCCKCVCEECTMKKDCPCKCVDCTCRDGKDKDACCTKTK